MDGWMDGWQGCAVGGCVIVLRTVVCLAVSSRMRAYVDAPMEGTSGYLLELIAEDALKRLPLHGLLLVLRHAAAGVSPGAAVGRGHGADAAWECGSVVTVVNPLVLPIPACR